MHKDSHCYRKHIWVKSEKQPNMGKIKLRYKNVTLIVGVINRLLYNR